ncbi:Hypothetical predicted protein, partial [Podarcis lilfordi]
IQGYCKIIKAPTFQEDAVDTFLCCMMENDLLCPHHCRKKYKEQQNELDSTSSR